MLQTHARIALATFFLSACVGTIDEIDPQEPPVIRVGEGAQDGPFACDESEPLALSRPLSRLTHRQLAGSIERLFGAEVFSDVQVGLAGVQQEGVSLDDNAFNQPTNDEYFEKLFRLFESVGAAAVSRDSLASFHDCDGALSDGCRRQLVARLGRRLFRRPLTSDEQSHFESVADTESLVASMMLSPQFLFHLETEASVGNLTQFEIASRLSFMIEDAVPDEALLQMAQDGVLDQDAITAQVQRLLRTDRGKEKLIRFFLRWLRITTVPTPPDVDAFSGDIELSSFTDESLVELRRYVSYVVYDKEGGLSDLLLGAEVFPESEQLAALFGSGVWSEGSEPEISLPARGLLLRSPIMISGRTETSPIMRGVFVLNEMMCQGLGFPGDDIIDARGNQDVALDAKTVREVTASMTSSAECASCHSLINPIGFALEDIDALGRDRTVEQHFEDGEVAEEYPIDAKVDALTLDGQSVSVDGSREFIGALAGSTQVSKCFVRKYFRFSQFRSDSSDNADQCHLNRMLDGLSGGSVLDMLGQAYVADVLSARRLN